jgi:hypothetical protein
MSKRPTDPGEQPLRRPPLRSEGDEIRLFDDEPALAGQEERDDPVLDAENADIEALLGRLPLAAPGPRLDLRIHSALNDASLARGGGADAAAAATDNSAPGRAHAAGPRPRSVWLGRFRPAALASAALVALAVGVGLLLPPRKPTVPGPPVQPVLNREVPQVIPSDLLVDPDLTSRLTLQAAPAAEASESHGAATAPSLTPIGLQQTFDHVQDDGVVIVDGKAAYQRIRRQAVRRIVVVDPATGEHVTVSIPTQELLVRRVEPF